MTLEKQLMRIDACKQVKVALQYDSNMAFFIQILLGIYLFKSPVVRKVTRESKIQF